MNAMTPPNPQPEKPAVPAVRRFRNTPRGLAEYEHGEWIGYIHYEDLKAQLTALEAENQELVKEANHDIKALEAENQKLREDKARLEWLNSYGACISHSRDGEVCNVWIFDEDGNQEPAEGYPQKCYGDFRSAIDAARAALSNAGEGKEKGK